MLWLGTCARHVTLAGVIHEISHGKKLLTSGSHLTMACLRPTHVCPLQEMAGATSPLGVPPSGRQNFRPMCRLRLLWGVGRPQQSMSFQRPMSKPPMHTYQTCAHFLTKPCTYTHAWMENVSSCVVHELRLPDVRRLWSFAVNHSLCRDRNGSAPEPYTAQPARKVRPSSVWDAILNHEPSTLGRETELAEPVPEVNPLSEEYLTLQSAGGSSMERPKLTSNYV